MKKIELLAPAGDLEKLKFAVDYGADAVYFGGELFSLRAGAGNLSTDEIREGVAYCHQNNAKAYLALNIYAHNEDIEPLREYLSRIRDIDIDAFIVSDPGVIDILKEIIPKAELHLSTQANTTNYAAASFWYRQGVKRVVLARELTFREITEMRKNIPAGMDIEAFVQGAMCISYSGRCLLSNYMIERDANRGQCAHPCRWKYRLVEEKRPDEFYPVEEDGRGTYILNSRDLCMIEHIPQLIEAGISSAKIEGRMKSIFYVANIVRAYRKAIDAYYADPAGYHYRDEWMRDLKMASHREFTTGFYFDRPTNKDQNYQTSEYTRDYSFTGIVLEYDDATGIAVVEQRNKMNIGDEIEVFGPDCDTFAMELSYMHNEEDEPIESAPHPQQILRIKFPKKVKKNYMLCKRK